MKKTLMLLGALAVLLMFAGCSNGSKNSSDEYSYTITEQTGLLYDQSKGPDSGFPQNSEGKYYGWMYYLESTTNTEYTDCIGRDIFYKVGENGCGNLYHKQCKEKVLKMLKDGKFEEFAPDWLNYKTIILTKEPE